MGTKGRQSSAGVKLMASHKTFPQNCGYFSALDCALPLTAMTCTQTYRPEQIAILGVQPTPPVPRKPAALADHTADREGCNLQRGSGPHR